jgi:hypothetical protein
MYSVHQASSQWSPRKAPEAAHNAIGLGPAMNGRSIYALELLTIAIPSESSRWLNYGFQAVV